MSAFREVNDVVAHLSRQRLPFAWYAMWPEGRSIQVEAAPRDCAAAIEYFADHRLVLANGALVRVHVTPRRGASSVSPPAGGSAGPDDEFDLDGLVGLDVNEATARANAAGWIVRAHEREALVTADFNPGRVNLVYGDDRVVESVSKG